MKIVKHPKKADCILLSTCAFKEEEENYSVSRLRFLKSFNRKLLVLGCLPDIARPDSRSLPKPLQLPKRTWKNRCILRKNKIKYSAVEDTNIIPKKLTVSTVPAAMKNSNKI